jgi:hypothetical protein
MTSYPHIILIKGNEGFADRLQVVSHCIQYCLKHDAYLCIDWRDNMWGQNKYDFFDFFDILGVKIMNLDDVVKYANKGASIIPNNVSINLIEAIPTKIIGFEYSLPNEILNNGFKRIDSDIIVFNTSKHRNYYRNNLLKNLILKPHISQIIKDKLKDIQFPYNMVHLRGTDRMESNTHDILINTLYNKFINNKNININDNVYIISDSKILIQLWMKKHPQSKVFNPFNTLLRINNITNKATHKFTEIELRKHYIDKFNLNIDTLTDFIGLCFAKHIIGNEKSLFYSMSRHLHTNENEHWLGKWK